MPNTRTASAPTAPAAATPTSASPTLARDASAGAPSFVPVRKRRAFEAVCDQIRRQIADGSLQAGHRLPGERELAEQFDISRSGVREALRSLELAGLVEARTGVNGGFFIRTGQPDGVTQAVRDMVALGQMPTASVTEARIELTCVALRLACERATAAELDAIEADIAFHAERFRHGQGSRNVRSVGEFYRLLARATHNEVIVMLVDALSEIVRTLLARVDPTPREDMIAVRRKVLQHLRERDAEAACAAMTQHLRNLDTYLEEQSRERATRGAPAKRALRATAG
ncbi:FadR/GntR family transcriptional regulator [Piscinibacter koreensis]|uniref:FadR family transcriptional regulator n=1 Tax=Piscinibacter koreensis TaxID=2742824 RepID=A0A7Y6NN32_9BURK|nr:GntR family transcriptional regulator [Schlegelella koreensis]NUZ06146.1 FadR family transcriptional regulator [Schlegelella koreensis]